MANLLTTPASDLVCVFCDKQPTVVTLNGRELPICPQCKDFKGLLTIPEWEDYTHEKWHETPDEE